ncbi:MAG: O-methyltransferase [Myxococcota bacterium]
MSDGLPAAVADARRGAAEAGFAQSSEDAVGRLLSAFAAAVPEGGRILELGTGVGVGLAWLVDGVGGRRDVEVISVDLDASVQDVARRASWPGNVRFVVGDGAREVGAHGPLDLLFADAPGGKLEGLERSIAALRPRGVLLVDDMDPARHDDAELVRSLADVRRRLLADPRLHSVELDTGSGVIVSVRRP